MTSRRKYRSHLFLSFPLFLGATLFFPTPVSANGGAGWIIVESAPTFAAVATEGLSLLIIIVIESVILWRLLRLNVFKSFWVALLANIISTIAGAGYAFLGFPSFLALLFPFLIIGFIYWWWQIKENIPRWVSATILGSIFLGLVTGILSQAFIPVSINLPISDVILMFGLMLHFFGASVFIEALFIGMFLKRSDVWKAVVIANVVSYLFLVPVAAYVTPPRHYFSSPSFMSRAKGTLRSCGSSQLAFREENKDGTYGTYQELADSGYIAEGYTQGNMIQNYSMTWEVNNFSTVQTEEFPHGVISTFTIIAYPRDTRPGFLLTFGIQEDQVVRLFNPDNGNDPDHVGTWDPIL